MANDNTKKPETQQAKKAYDAQLEGKSFNLPDDLYKDLTAKVKKIEDACKALNILIDKSNEQNLQNKVRPNAPGTPNKSPKR